MLAVTIPPLEHHHSLSLKLCDPQARGWATDLSAGVDGDGYSQNSGCFLFSVNITLTDAGLHAGLGFGLGPVGLLFSYLNMLRQQGGG
jgi:secreted Zn-dependent insulinase-like peptidase